MPRILLSHLWEFSHTCLTANTWYMHPLPCLNPHCSSPITHSVPALTLLISSTKQLTHYTQQTNTSRVATFTFCYPSLCNNNNNNNNNRPQICPSEPIIIIGNSLPAFGSSYLRSRCTEIKRKGHFDSIIESMSCP